MTRIGQLARMFAALSATNEAILRTTSEADLFQRVCDAAVHGGKFKRTSAMLAEPDKSLRLAASASIGKTIGNPALSVDEKTESGQGLAGIAYRSGRSCTSNDTLNDERLQLRRRFFEKNGLGAITAIPILEHVVFSRHRDSL